MGHYWENVPVFGRVAFSRHAQDRLARDMVTETVIQDVLYHGEDRPDGQATWREKNGVRLVVIKPTPYRGAMLVVTGFRVMGQARVR